MKFKAMQFCQLLGTKGMSVAQIAQKSGLQAETVYAQMRSARKAVRWNTVWRLSQALDCEPSEIAVCSQ